MEQYNHVLELWQAYKIAFADDLDKCLDSFYALFAYHSGKIENDGITWHDMRELFENGRIVGFTGNSRTLLEQQNQKVCHELVKENINKEKPLSADLIRELHRALTEGTYDERQFAVNGERPGEFKKHDYVTGIHEAGSSAENVENDLKELINEVGAYDGKSVLDAAAYLHARFEFIHPFADGNGRVGRTLMNYYLMTHDHPPLIVFAEDKRLYYEYLQKYDEAEELKPLVEFLRYETVKTWGNALTLSQRVKPERKNLSDSDQRM